MSPRSLLAALALAAFAGLAPAGAFAQPPGDAPPRREAAAPADTGAFFPTWLHPWLELGGGWVAAPAYARKLYDSGQGFAAGVATSPSRRLQGRLAVDYQMVTSNHTADYILDWGGGYYDTLRFNFQGTAWDVLLRGETGLRLGGGLWATGGLGAGYMNGGYQDFSLIPGSGYTSGIPALMRNGWGWVWTTAVRWDVEPDPMLPFGLDVRHTGMRRGDEFVRWWSIRLCYRIPDVARRGGRRP